MSQKNKNSAFMNPVNITPDLATIVGKGPMPRTEIVKKVWDYIKKNNLQDPKNKRNILPDDALAKVFGSKNPIDMFQMTKALSNHIVK
ncbi:DNA topoisomerase I/SWI domain fusion protein,SWIB/MDM2 domain [Chlamydia poikilotherma]|uniref:DNA topoisomerase I/SWI domain fusion protein,SWIB/MDM2 domain n=1 Tax=Chlamydia poikilotherma TaxID=1967783 RepID=A0A3B0PUR6_9CHLA|nr:SWIB/MDM2 domain-containing protein [Chlamydia poikilotherma]SYX08656.1 DNA topoisomerase I/SWI domain fusion protein,SWIB/MDM2 domain [Chlamydia poikilotherma]